MNILIVNHERQPQYLGGIKRVSLILAKEWEKLGINCHFLTVSNKGNLVNLGNNKHIIIPEKYDGVYDEKVEKIVEEYVKNNKINIIINQHCDIIPITELLSKIKKNTGTKVVAVLHFSPSHKIDIVKTSFFNKYKLGLSVKGWIQDCLLYLKYSCYGKRKIINQLRAEFDYIASVSDKLVLLSDHYIPILSSISPSIDSGKIIAINNPMVMKSMVIDNKESTIVWVGRVGYDAKRIDKMMRIWRMIQDEFPGWSLKILGCGSIDHFKHLAHHYGVRNIEFMGFKDPFPFYSKASIICSTSVAEGLPMNLLEGMAYGCVPISFDSFASIYDIIDDEINGFIIKDINLKSYSEKLALLMKNSALRDKMACEAVKKIEKFQPTGIAKKWIDLFEIL